MSVLIYIYGKCWEIIILTGDKMSEKSQKLKDGGLFPLYRENEFPNIHKLIISFREFLANNYNNNIINFNNNNQESMKNQIKKGNEDFKKILARELH